MVLPVRPWTWTDLYLDDTLQPVARIPGRQRLQSSSTSALDVPSTRLSTVGDRAFPVAAARTWNSLPAEVMSSNSLQTFKTTLKSHLFLASFPSFPNCYSVCKVSEVLRHFFFTLNLMQCNVMSSHHFQNFPLSSYPSQPVDL